MRCAQARQRLIASHGDAGDDRELIRHLQTCSECAAFARAERALGRDLAAVTADKGVDDMPLSTIRSRVEAQLRESAHSKFKEVFLMSAALRQIRRRPALSFSMATLVVVLFVATLVPFSFTRTVGYEVAIAGVNRDLAVDTAKVSTLLTALGVKDAAVTLGDCDTTCVLKISSLQSEDDVDLVTTAFAELGDFDCEGMQVKCDTISGTLLNKVRHMVVVNRVATRANVSLNRDIAIKTIKNLDSLCGGDFNIYVTGDSGACIVGAHAFMSGSSDSSAVIALSELCGDTMLICVPDSQGGLTKINMNDPDAQERLRELGINIQDSNLHSGASQIWIMNNACSGKGGNAEVTDAVKNAMIMTQRGNANELIFVDKDGIEHHIDLSAPDAAEQLKALSLDMKIIRSDDGSICGIMKGPDGTETKIRIRPSDDETADFDKALEETPPQALPDGFELKQNHPNPFNPITEISFTIPQSEHVQLQIFNVTGRKVKTLVDGNLSAGEHTYEWDSTDDSGGKVASGVYFYRLTAGDVTATKKMTLIK
jgi:hypothetical protein